MFFFAKILALCHFRWKGPIWKVGRTNQTHADLGAHRHTLKLFTNMF